MDETLEPLQGRLDSWKGIARYLGRDITTVQRWEKREGMPVHRHLHDRKGSVYGFRGELDAWMRGRSAALAAQDSEPAAAEVRLPRFLPQLPRGAPLLWALFGLFLVAAGVMLWARHTERFWRSPVAGARFQSLTAWAGSEQAAAISRDGRMVAFLSDRAGQPDVWISQVGSGQFHNMTGGKFPELANDSIRTLGFSPDGSLVTFWVRQRDSGGAARIGIWAVPVLGGEPRPYLADAAEYDWSTDGRKLAFHTTAAGDPLFIGAGDAQTGAAPVFTAPAGLHSHYPLWSPDGEFLYVVQGTLPDKLDLWRIPAGGGTALRITSHNARVSHPVFLDHHTLAYLADTDGSGQRLFSLDIRRRIAHGLTQGPERYASLAASADGRRLVLTLASPKTTLWRMRIGEEAAQATAPEAVTLTTTSGSMPRLGPDYLLHVSATGDGESIWKVEAGEATELWRGRGARVLGAPAVSMDGRRIAFAVQQDGRTLMHAMNADGTGLRVIADSLEVRGDLAWSPDGASITTAVLEQGRPRLFRVPLEGGPPALLGREYAIDPIWAADGSFVLYAGPDIGTTFDVKAARPDGTAYPLPALTLTRGAKLHGFLPGSRQLVVSRGDLHHRNLWLIDLDTGAERQLTDLPAGFNARAFDVAIDGREVVVERLQEDADVVLLER